MPELPEVQSVINDLAVIKGLSFNKISVKRPNILNLKAADFKAKLLKQKINKLTRRAKYLVFELDDYYLITHLRMTGVYLIYHKNELIPHKHHRVIFDLASCYLVYQDLRALGKIYLIKPNKLADFFKKLGLEPFDSKLTKNYLYQRLQTRKCSIKNFLLDQKEVVGIGNIYAAEILFKARISPKRLTNNISKLEAGLILSSIKSILKRAIKMQGTTISDYKLTSGDKGKFQASLKVYGKENQPCPICRKPISRLVQQQRSSFFCINCQK